MKERDYLRGDVSQQGFNGNRSVGVYMCEACHERSVEENLVDMDRGCCQPFCEPRFLADIQRARIDADCPVRSLGGDAPVGNSASHLISPPKASDTLKARGTNICVPYGAKSRAFQQSPRVNSRPVSA